MGIEYKSKRTTVLTNITNWIFENFFRLITATRLKSILNSIIDVVDEAHGKNTAKYADYFRTTDITLSTLVPGLVLGDYTLKIDDIVLLSGQTSTGENGLWRILVSGSPERPETFDTDTKQNASIVIVNLLSTGQTDRAYLVEKLAGAIIVNAISSGGKIQIISNHHLAVGTFDINHTLQTKFFTVTFQDSTTGSEANQYPVQEKTQTTFKVHTPVDVPSVDIILKA